MYKHLYFLCKSSTCIVCMFLSPSPKLVACTKICTFYVHHLHVLYQLCVPLVYAIAYTTCKNDVWYLYQTYNECTTHTMPIIDVGRCTCILQVIHIPTSATPSVMPMLYTWCTLCTYALQLPYSNSRPNVGTQYTMLYLHM